MVQEFPAFYVFRNVLVSILIDKLDLELFQPVRIGFDTHVSSILVE